MAYSVVVELTKVLGFAAGIVTAAALVVCLTAYKRSKR
jgi:tetrahydromethanopterin S-methyltransferase subunit F